MLPQELFWILTPQIPQPAKRRRISGRRGGREETTGNTSAVRRLQIPLSWFSDSFRQDIY